MKKNNFNLFNMLFRLFFLFVSFNFNSFPVYAQSIITNFPGIEEQSQPNVKITKVELTEHHTILSMTFKNVVSKKSKQEEALDRMMEEIYRRDKELGIIPDGGRTADASINFDPKSRLLAKGKRFKFIKAIGIPTNTDRTISSNEKVSFKVYFERLDPGIEVFDLYEGKDFGTKTFWNFYGIHINNPIEKKAKENVYVEPQNVISFLSVKGTVYDALSKRPINAHLSYTPGFRKSNDSISTNINLIGSYHLALKTGITYQLNITSEGYQTEILNLDLTNSADKPVTKDIFLMPIPTNKSIVDSTNQHKLPTVTTIGETIQLKNIYFNVSESVLLPASFTELDQLVQMMNDKQTMEIRIEGHTDNSGDFDANLALSTERALAVKNYLIEKGISINRIETKGFGSTRPLILGDKEGARSKNRRVEFVILKL
jgi:OmpA-OmpF porin, OOP family